MDALTRQAKEILCAALDSGMPPAQVARLYDCQIWHVYGARNPEYEYGPLTARRIIRAHLAHLQAKRQGEILRILENNARYKGNRIME